MAVARRGAQGPAGRLGEANLAAAIGGESSRGACERCPTPCWAPARPADVEARWPTPAEAPGAWHRLAGANRGEHIWLSCPRQVPPGVGRGEVPLAQGFALDWGLGGANGRWQ